MVKVGKRRLGVQREGVRIGRVDTFKQEENQVVIDDPSVGRLHATIRINRDKLVIVDHSSRCGTLVNDQRIKAERKQQIQDGDIIRIGNCDNIITVVEEEDS